ncbi:hypothetical protein RAB80_015356 [Fusarium oxysporum f. sp. vasinfectum]|nr:hypothetical protein RAB80_015356 [Fusarium oxysporum f. sp. vasinfectum]KAK2925340.1 hypothetical protein FoTM2_015620 [Fusarium oxysporum f. sp. vasinfectum]
MKATNEPVQSRLAAAIGTLGWGNPARSSIDVVESIRKVRSGLEEDYWAYRVHLEVLVDIVDGGITDASAVFCDSSIGKYDVQGADAMLLLERGDGLSSIRGDAGVKLDDDQIRTLALWKIPEGL